MLRTISDHIRLYGLPSPLFSRAFHSSYSSLHLNPRLEFYRHSSITITALSLTQDPSNEAYFDDTLDNLRSIGPPHRDVVTCIVV
jgi:hypothetical protein